MDVHRYLLAVLIDLRVQIRLRASYYCIVGSRSHLQASVCVNPAYAMRQVLYVLHFVHHTTSSNTGYLLPILDVA